MNKTMNKTRIILISLCLLSLLLFLTCCGEKIVVHENEFEDEISYDDNYHFYKATCGHDVTSTKEAHLFGEERIIRAATSTQNGLKEKECSVCGYKQEEVENMLNVKKIPRLQKGDTIALIAPASPGSSSSASDTKSALEAKGFKVKVVIG